MLIRANLLWRKPIAWILLSLVSVSGTLFTFRYFPEAFPLVTLDLQMDRTAALTRARMLARQHGFGPKGYEQAASFRLDGRVQNFVELEAGGNEAFRQMLAGDLYAPYTWQVRHFRESETNETLIRFTPQGKPYGFVEKLPEDEPGAALSADSARDIAETAAVGDWQIDLTAYVLVEQSQEVQTGGRIDHTLVYERPSVQVGDGQYRLRLVVGGDKLTELSHFIKVPEAFSRRYTEMRSANNTIALTANIAMFLLYILGGCIIGLFFLLRQRWVLWRQPLAWGLFVSFLQVLVGLNQWPLLWMNYDTALSMQTFQVQQVLFLLAQFLLLSVLLTLSFMAAESLSRKAFPQHLQMWRWWSAEVAGSPTILGYTVSGYLLVGVFFAFEVTLYLISSRWPGWWTPSNALFHPDVLASYFPWLSSIARSLQAGFWEECLFRAVPIAGAALIGQRFGKRRAWIIGAFILQALVFGAGHANYPAQPAYARVVELIVPSIAFGLIYIYFGLLPVIILHFTFDVVWFALPLFAASVPGIWIDRLLVILLALVPLGIVLRARLKASSWREVSEKHLNQSWLPAVVEPREAVLAVPKPIGVVGDRVRQALIVAGTAGLILWAGLGQFQTVAPALEIDRETAHARMQQSLTERGIELAEPWQTVSTVRGGPGQAHRFIWQTAGPKVYEELLGTYLSPPRWQIRAVRFEGDVAERAEEYGLSLDARGEVLRWRHQLPEARSGASLEEPEARGLAHDTLQTLYGLEPDQRREVSAVPKKLPNRQDWTLTFSDESVHLPEKGEARIVIGIAGDRLVDTYRHIHVPESWQREERDRRNWMQILGLIRGVLLSLIVLSGVIAAIVSWSRKNFSASAFWVIGGLLLGVNALQAINDWPSLIARFSTAQPFQNQALAAIGVGAIVILFSSAGLALLVGFVLRPKRSVVQSPMDGQQGVWLGVSLGLLAAGLKTAVATLAPSSAPVWPNYSALGNHVPLVAAGLQPLVGFVFATAVLLFIISSVDDLTTGWTRRRTLGAIGLIVIGAILAGGEPNGESIPYWLISGLIGGVLLTLIYHVVLRLRPALVPLITGSITILSTINQGLYQAHPTALSGAILAILLVVLLTWYWYKELVSSQLDQSSQYPDHITP